MHKVVELFKEKRDKVINKALVRFFATEGIEIKKSIILDNGLEHTFKVQGKNYVLLVEEI